MLRLGRGWSADLLAREVSHEAAESLDRSTIAKIESDNRQIKVGDVLVVARVFGIIADDLMKSGEPSVFLSYAERDDSIAAEVTAWLSDRGFRMLQRSGHELDGQKPGLRTQNAIGAADAFVVLLTSNYLITPRCRGELDLAARKQQSADAIHVLRITDTAAVPDIGEYPSTDLTPNMSGLKRETALSRLGSAIILSRRAAVAGSGTRDRAQGWQAFMGRRDELDVILRGLDNPAGPDFWLIMSPPGFGKSRLLAQVAAETKPQGWDSRTVDLRHVASDQPDVMRDAVALIRELSGYEAPPSGSPAHDLRRIAQEIIRAGRPVLWLLDSAELIPASTTVVLRQHLCQIHSLVQDAGDASARFAFVAASRTGDAWRGVHPAPRLSIVALAEFGATTVQAALDRQARRMNRVRSAAELQSDATLVRRVTEGVPELVQLALDWIQGEEWLEIDRLESQEFFDRLVRPYIDHQLLVRDSLLPDESGEPGRLRTQIRVMTQALRGLVPYRFFTQSHVRRHRLADESFGEALIEAGWSDDDLWRHLSASTLVSRPLDEPWYVIPAAIRRLLFRYFYARTEQADAHLQARDYVQVWAEKQTGQEQAIGLVECIWHQAVALRLDGSAHLGGILSEIAQKSSLSIQNSSAYTVHELREFAADLIVNDEEIRQELAGDEGLPERLARIVQFPAESSAT